MTDKKAPAIELLVNKQDIDKAISSIQRRGLKLDNDVQQAALSCINHHHKHGDVSLINRLIAAMPKGSRVNALREYVETYSAAVYNEETKEFRHSKTKACKLEAALAVHWTTFKPEKAYTPIDDPMDRVSSLISKFENDRKKLGDASAVPVEMIEALKAFRTDQTVASVTH